MKTIYRICGILMISALVLTSCGGNDEVDNRKEYTFTGDAKQTIVITGSANDFISKAPVTAKLEDLLKESVNYGWPITAATQDLASGNSVSITGLKSGVILKGFSLKINDITKNFGDITADKANLYTSAYVSYFTEVFNKMKQTKNLTIEVSYTPSVEIVSTENVKFEFALRGIYTYLK